MREHRDFRVFVRSKLIVFDRTSINRFCSLSDVDNNDYSKIHEEDMNPKKIVRVLARINIA